MRIAVCAIDETIYDCDEIQLRQMHGRRNTFLKKKIAIDSSAKSCHFTSSTPTYIAVSRSEKVLLYFMTMV